MSLTFNNIPVSIRVPGQYIEIDNSRAVAGTPAYYHRVLLLGQKISAGTATALEPVLVTSVLQAETLFGRGSQLALMFDAFKTNNDYTETWAIPCADPAGVAATSLMVVTGPATDTGIMNLYIGGKLVQVSISNGNTAVQIAAAIAAAVTADTSLPVTATQGSNPNDHKVTLTAKNVGAIGNQIDVRVNHRAGERLPSGVGITIPAMASGTLYPTIGTLTAVFGGDQWHTVVCPWADDTVLDGLESEMLSRWGPLVQKEGVIYTAVGGSVGTMQSFGQARNSFLTVCVGCATSPSLPWQWAAAAAALDAYESDPARPRHNLLLKGILPPSPASRLTYAERNTLLNDGIATFYIAPGDGVYTERLITTYQTNPQGVPDPSYLDVETVRTVAYLRYSIRVRIGLRYPRHKLANDGTRFAAGQPIVTPKLIRAELLALFREWEFAGLAENIDQFKRDLIVERNADDANRVDALIPPDVVNQFRVFAAAVQFRL